MSRNVDSRCLEFTCLYRENMNRPKHILLHLLLVVLPVLMAVAPATAQMTVYAGQTSILSVDEVPGDTYTWELYNDVTGVNFAAVPGNCPVTDAFFVGGINTGPTVNVTWLTPGTYFFKVTAVRANCTDNLKVGMMIVLEQLPTAAIEDVSPICAGDEAMLIINLTGTSPWSIDVFDGTTTTTYDNILVNRFALNIRPGVTTTYTVTRVTDANGVSTTPSNAVTLLVHPKPVSSPIYRYDPLTKKK